MLLQKLRELEPLVLDLINKVDLKIGIGVTTHNRPESFRLSYDRIVKYSSGCKIVVVDDGSTTPVMEATYRFEVPQGIAKAKNKCLELLKDCDHIFLFDDDAFPQCENWYRPYIDSGEPHLMYIFEDFSTGNRLNDCVKVFEDGVIRAYSHPRGVMLYLQRKCLAVVGGMGEVFGKWGWEHPDLSIRIFNAGLTSFKFADVVGSEKLIYAADEHQQVKTTVSGAERQKWIARNRSIFEIRADSRAYEPFTDDRHVYLTCYLNGVADPQRGETFANDTKALQPLINSVNKLKSGVLIILTDCLEETDTEFIKYIKVKPGGNPYFQRWALYRRFLQNSETVRKVFCIDATDVEVLRSPFGTMREGVLYSGDEPETLDSVWLKTHHKKPEILQFISDNANLQMLNAGVVGGSRFIVLEFIQKLLEYIASAEADRQQKRIQGAGLTDMAAFNVVARTHFGDRLSSGMHVTSTFKKFEDNGICWFKHK